MKNAPPKILLLLICLWAVPSWGQEAKRAGHVVVISFDQGNAQEIKKSDKMPTFHEVAAEGARTWEAYTIVPSITLPSHTSMLTGVGIQKHQIDWNNYAPDKGIVGVPTIFSLAKEKGLHSAMYVGKEKFQHLLIPDSVDHFEVSGGALEVANAFARDLAKNKYDLYFLHFRDIDSQGHAFGLRSPEWTQALVDADNALKIIRDAIRSAGLADDTVMILSADHGGHNIQDKEGKTRGAHGSSKPEDVEIPWVAWGKGVKKNTNITAAVSTYDTAATALWLLGVPLPESFWGRPVVSAFETTK